MHSHCSSCSLWCIRLHYPHPQLYKGVGLFYKCKYTGDNIHINSLKRTHTYTCYIMCAEYKIIFVWFANEDSKYIYNDTAQNTCTQKRYVMRMRMCAEQIKLKLCILTIIVHWKKSNLWCLLYIIVFIIIILNNYSKARRDM